VGGQEVKAMSTNTEGVERLPLLCHHCGLESRPRSWILWGCANGNRHLFCDNECLQRWLEERETIALAESQEDIRRLAREVNRG
jgi:hypothetical protein